MAFYEKKMSTSASRESGAGGVEKIQQLSGPPLLPRGKPKSGRIWREPGDRCKGRVASFGRKKSWKTIQSERCETKAMKELQRELREAVQKRREERKQRIAEKRQRKIENDRKGEVVQKITNVAKLKRLKKKQMRRIEKR